MRGVVMTVRHLDGATLEVLGLTRRGDLKTKLRAFDLGVDDILAVPFSPEELLARAIVITRRATGADRPIVPAIRIGEIEIDILSRQVRAGHSVVHLSGIEQSLLYLLASRAGRVVTREEILDAVWGTDFVTESNLVDRHVRSLRIKLQNDYRNPRFIATVPGQGYRRGSIRQASPSAFSSRRPASSGRGAGSRRPPPHSSAPAGPTPSRASGPGARPGDGSSTWSTWTAADGAPRRSSSPRARGSRSSSPTFAAPS
jgi:DNA-binding response OmpR family regulator